MGLTRPRAYQIYDIDYKQAVRVVTTSNVTLSGGAPSLVDGVTLSLNDRVLVTGQNTASQNGLYYVTTVGTGANGTWQRSIDGNETGEVEAGMIVMVTEGTLNADKQWKLVTNNPIVIGTTGLAFEQITGGGGGTPGGSNTQVQYNSAGTFAGSAAFTFNTVSNALAVTGNITGGNLSGTIIVGTLSTASQPNITSIGTLTTLSVTGNITSGNLTGATLVSSTNLTGTLTTASQPNITGVGTLSSLTVAANVAGGNLTTGGQVVSTGNITSSTGHVGTIYTNSIINTGANGTGNIGSSSLYFNTAFIKATSAQYADLAEMYVADANYTPGTVVEFGGVYEITITTQSHSTAVAGIISTDPSYLMNSTQTGEHVLPVALTGRVPCQVLGPVNKGDVLVASHIPGVAQRIGINWQPGCVLGKSMEKIISNEVKTIEVAVGRL